MKCKLNYKFGILLVICVLLLLIVIKKGKINEKFNIFANDNNIKTKLIEHDTILSNQEKQDHLLQIQEEQKESVNETKNMIYQLRQRFLLLKQLF